jgi:hypothetical protein
MKKTMLVALLALFAAFVLGLAGCGFTPPTTTTSSRTSTMSTTTTTTEPPATWKQLQPAGEAPAARCYGNLAYDTNSRKVILFGGFDGTSALSETWAYDPVAKTWTNLSPTSADQPSGAGQIPTVYDPVTSKVIAYDGTTWGYDPNGNTWAALSPKGTKLKPARLGSSMVYDSNTRKVFLFGGTDNSTWYNQTWSYDPSANTWTKLEPAGEVPAGRSDAGMAYDPTSGKIVLFGGTDASFACLNDTWLYDPVANTWTTVTPAGEIPPARSGHGMAYDAHSKRVILFGGVDTEFLCYNDTWAYDSTAGTWTDLVPAGESPQARARMAVVYAVGSEELLLFGGSEFLPDATGGFPNQVYLNDTWGFGVLPGE